MALTLTGTVRTGASGGYVEATVVDDLTPGSAIAATMTIGVTLR